MAWLRKSKRSPYYYVVWRENGRTKWRTTGTADKQFARQVQQALEAELWKREQGLAPRGEGISLADARAEYLTQKQTQVRPHTLRSYRATLRRFEAWLGAANAQGTPLRLLDPGLAEMYMQARRSGHEKLPGRAVSPHTLRIDAANLNVFFRWCVARDWAGPRLTVRKPAMRRDSEHVQFLTPEQAQAVLDDETNTLRRQLYRFLLLTGARIGETCDLRWGSVDRRVGCIYLSGMTTKSGKRRTIELTPTLSALLDERRLTIHTTAPLERIFPLSESWASHSFKRCIRRCRLPDSLSIHSLRHTAASWWLMSGVPIQTVSEILGHSSITVTERHYKHLVSGYRADAMEQTPLVKLRG